MNFRLRMLDNDLRSDAAGANAHRTLPDNLSFQKCGEIEFHIKPRTLLSDGADNQRAVAKIMDRSNAWTGIPVGVCTFRNVYLLRGLIIDPENRIVWRGGLINMSGAFKPNMAVIGGKERVNDRWSIDLGDFDHGQSRETGVLVSGPGFANYGHWLVDYIPRINRVVQAGLDAAQIVHPGASSWGQNIAELVLGQPLTERSIGNNEAVHFETLTVPTSLRSAGVIEASFALATWRMLSERLAASEPAMADMPGERIFVSRRQWNTKKHSRVLQNAEEVEAAFKRAGFTIVYPETLSLAQQRHVFSGARVVAGEDGSGLHNTVYCQPGTRVGVISMGRTNPLHLVIANILDLHVAYCSAIPTEVDGAEGFTLTRDTVESLLGQLI